MPQQSGRLKICLAKGLVILNLVDASRVSYPKVKARNTFSITPLTSFLLSTPSFILTSNICWFSAFQFFACEGVERPEEGRQSLRWKKAAARKGCLKYVREINNPREKKRERIFVVNWGIHLCFSHRKSPEGECCPHPLQLYPINKHEAKWQASSPLLYLTYSSSSLDFYSRWNI